MKHNLPRTVNLPFARQVTLNYLRFLRAFGYNVIPGQLENDCDSLLSGTPVTAVSDAEIDAIPFINLWVENLTTALNSPSDYGFSKDFSWRFGQSDTLKLLIPTLMMGYTCPLLGMAGGGGKTHLEGAVAAAFARTTMALGYNFHILLVTSRIAIATDMGTRKRTIIISDENRHADSQSDSPLIHGDIVKWLDGKPENVRVLAGSNWSKKNEIEKQSLVTIVTYAGLRKDDLMDYFAGQNIALVLCDESHNATGHINAVLRQLNASIIGLSATPLGNQDRNVFNMFDPVATSEDTTLLHRDPRSLLASFIPPTLMIQRGELAPVRFYRANHKVDLEDLSVIVDRNGKLRRRSGDIHRLLGKDPERIAKTVLQFFLNTDEQIAPLSLLPFQRQGLSTVVNTTIAREASDACNDIVSPEIRGMYGTGYSFDFVHSYMSRKIFYKKLDRYNAGKIDFLFYVDIIGEGVNVIPASLFVNFRYFGHSLNFRLMQHLYRALRIYKMKVNNVTTIIDTVIIDAVHDEYWSVADALAAYGLKVTNNGRLIAGLPGQLEFEQKVVSQMRQGHTARQILDGLNHIEQTYAGFLIRRANAQASLVHPVGRKKNTATTATIDTRVLFKYDAQIEFSASSLNADQLMVLVFDSLRDAGITFLDMLTSYRYSNDPLRNRLANFIKIPMGRFLNGANLINLVLNESGPIDQRKKDHFDKIVEQAGFPRSLAEYNKSPVTLPRKLRSDTRIVRYIVRHNYESTLTFYCLDNFGIKPEFSVLDWTGRLGEEGYYLCQCSISIQGRVFTSRSIASIDKTSGRRLAAKEVLETVKSSTDLVDYKSEVFKFTVSAILMATEMFGINIDFKDVETTDKEFVAMRARIIKRGRPVAGPIVYARKSRKKYLQAFAVYSIIGLVKWQVAIDEILAFRPPLDAKQKLAQKVTELVVETNQGEHSIAGYDYFTTKLSARRGASTFSMEGWGFTPEFSEAFASAKTLQVI